MKHVFYMKIQCRILNDYDKIQRRNGGIFMIQFAVCDDNINELSNIVQLINLYRISKNFSCEYVVFHNGLDLISALEKGKRFDIYFLDIIMPGLTGIDIAKEI